MPTDLVLIRKVSATSWPRGGGGSGCATRSAVRPTWSEFEGQNGSRRSQCGGNYPLLKGKPDQPSTSASYPSLAGGFRSGGAGRFLHPEGVYDDRRAV